MYLETERLRTEHMQSLLNGDLLAIRLSQFIDASTSQKLGVQIINKGFDRYVNAPSIGRIGMAFYEAENQPERMASYFEGVFDNIDELRRRCTPYLSPIDMLRCTLDEVWPAGATLETLYGKKMYVGLSRVVQPDVHFLAHHDILAKDAPGNYQAISLQGQLAANVYLKIPEQGGELQIWKTELSPAEFDQMRGDSYGIHPDLLGAPEVQICPGPGDLIIFNSRKMHAVTPGKGDLRLSLSCFVGYRGPAMPLTFWS